VLSLRFFDNRKVTFYSAQDVSIIRLIDDLTLSRIKRMGVPFCFGTLEIPEQDFRLIASKMVDDKSLFDK